MFRLPKKARKNQYLKIWFVSEQKYEFILTADLLVIPVEFNPVHEGQNIGTTSIMLVELCVIQIKTA